MCVISKGQRRCYHFWCRFGNEHNNLRVGHLPLHCVRLSGLGNHERCTHYRRFYATSKLLIYLFLGTSYHCRQLSSLTNLSSVEKVRIVWSPSGSQSPRFKSAVSLSASPSITHLNHLQVFVIGIVAVAAYGVVFGLMVADLIYFLREDGSCVIGLKHFVSISLLVYDL